MSDGCWEENSQHVLRSIERNEREISVTRSDAVREIGAARSDMTSAIGTINKQIQETRRELEHKMDSNHRETRDKIDSAVALIGIEVAKRSSVSGQFDVVRTAVVAILVAGIGLVFQIIFLNQTKGTP